MSRCAKLWAIHFLIPFYPTSYLGRIHCGTVDQTESMDRRLIYGSFCTVRCEYVASRAERFATSAECRKPKCRVGRVECVVCVCFVCVCQWLKAVGSGQLDVRPMLEEGSGGSLLACYQESEV